MYRRGYIESLCPATPGCPRARNIRACGRRARQAPYNSTNQNVNNLEARASRTADACASHRPS
eukprot:958587-Alexandrium_andersonii.AAC.1